MSLSSSVIMRIRELPLNPPCSIFSTLNRIVAQKFNNQEKSLTSDIISD